MDNVQKCDSYINIQTSNPTDLIHTTAAALKLQSRIRSLQAACEKINK
jgi:hypothetical protein